MNRYLKNIEKDIAAMMQQKPKRTAGNGLLAPKKTMNAETPQPKSSRDFVLNITADIRRKRLSLTGDK
jgi:hypothetical protein